MAPESSDRRRQGDEYVDFQGVRMSGVQCTKLHDTSLPTIEAVYIPGLKGFEEQTLCFRHLAEKLGPDGIEAWTRALTHHAIGTGGLRNGSLSGATIRGNADRKLLFPPSCDFGSTHLNHTIFENVLLKNPIFKCQYGYEGTQFRESDLSLAEFQVPLLSRSMFQGCTLDHSKWGWSNKGTHETCLAGCDLNSVSLLGGKFVSLRVERSQLRDVSFAGSVGERLVIQGGTWTDVDFAGSDVPADGIIVTDNWRLIGARLPERFRKKIESLDAAGTAHIEGVRFVSDDVRIPTLWDGPALRSYVEALENQPNPEISRLALVSGALVAGASLGLIVSEIARLAGSPPWGIEGAGWLSFATVCSGLLAMSSRRLEPE